ncbi:MAG: hypothetical protein ABW189_00270 [Rickettsiales bacterium]
MFRFKTLAICIAFVACQSGAASAVEFNFDRGIGFAKGRDVEDWVSAKDARGASLFQQIYTEGTANRPGLSDGTNAATAVGNSISVQTGPGGVAVVNATQINAGNQSAEINLKNLQTKTYKNVEIPAYKIQMQELTPE